MTKFELLKKHHEMACHNLLCYSSNRLMEKSEKGFEAEWNQAKEECKLLEEMMREYDNKTDAPEHLYYTKSEVLCIMHNIDMAFDKWFEKIVQVELDLEKETDKELSYRNTDDTKEISMCKKINNRIRKILESEISDLISDQ